MSYWQLITGPNHGAKIIPRFVNTKEELDQPDPDRPVNTLRDSWKSVAIMYFDRNLSKPVNYDITDWMILRYSKQYEELENFIKERLPQFRTWNQLADEEDPGPANGGVDRGQKGRHVGEDTHQHPEAPYFGITWLVKPLKHGPEQHACGCGCGCGCRGTAGHSDHGYGDSGDTPAA